MFRPEERAQLREELLRDAAEDRRIGGAALTGSAAAGREDQWSDVDLAFGVAEGSDLEEVLADWTARMYDRHQAVHHVDVRAGAWVYRVFLRRDTMQVDLAFVSAAEFRALGPSFRMVSGTAREARHTPRPDAAWLIGMAWLYALHARSALARRKLWQAEYMISGLRDHALALACVRHGLPAAHGRGMDQLPAEVTAPFGNTLVGRLDAVEMASAFRAAVAVLLREIEAADPALARRLQDTLVRLAQPVDFPLTGFP
jgi:hypothetical protein